MVVQQSRFSCEDGVELDTGDQGVVREKGGVKGVVRAVQGHAQSSLLRQRFASVNPLPHIAILSSGRRMRPAGEIFDSKKPFFYPVIHVT